jgi:hypothetical protein
MVSYGSATSPFIMVVPEPASLSLLTVATTMLFRRRKQRG